ncbi:MAG: hypothetical protein GF331_15025, partial [Chitinivibrionales bacterium]|nr:hypothetical protein [Chitinivibrionales bacterium]
MNRIERWCYGVFAAVVLIGCTGDLQEPPDDIIVEPPISEACTDSQWVVVSRWVGDSLVYDSIYVASWVADSLVVRTILDLNNLTSVSYYAVTGVDTCGRVTELNLSAQWLSTLVAEASYLTYLPPLVGALSELRILKVYNNTLDILPSSIGNLSKLHTLEAQRCSLDSIPESLCDLDSLQQVYLFDNDLVRLPDSIGRLSNLVQLELADNELDSLPESIMDLPHISAGTMTVTGNHLCTVSDELAAWLDTASYERSRWREKQIGCDSTVSDTSAVRDALDWAGLTTVGVGEVATMRAGRVVAVDLSGHG